MDINVKDLVNEGYTDEQIMAILYSKEGKKECTSPVIDEVSQDSASFPQNALKFENDRELYVTPINELREYSKGSLISLPPFGPNQPFVAKLSRPSMMTLAKSGAIPNSLMATANKMFSNDNKAIDNDDFIKDMYDICVVIAKASLVEPTFEQLEYEGVKLTDDQLIAIFMYATKGVSSLDSFRQQ